MKVISRLVKSLVSNKKYSRKFLDLLTKKQIWDYLGGYRYASEFVKFAKDGYDDQLIRNHALGPKDSILVLGACKGRTTQEWLSRYEAKVFAVEPIPEFVDILRSRFGNNSKVEIFPFAVGGNSGEIEFSFDEWSTSSYIHSDKRVLCEQRDVETFIRTLNPFPKVIELNIEGGEYEVIYKLIETGQIRDISTLLIQFHNYDLKCEYDRAKIRLLLATTHDCVFNYDWVWERWEKTDK